MDVIMRERKTTCMHTHNGSSTSLETSVPRSLVEEQGRDQSWEVVPTLPCSGEISCSVGWESRVTPAANNPCSLAGVSLWPSFPE